MNSTSIFRLILVLGIILSITSIIANFSLSETLPPELQSYLSQLEEQDITVGDGLAVIVMLPVLFLSLISTIGVWFFKRWARNMYVFIIIIFIPFIPLFGPYISTGWETLFEYPATMIEGAIIVMMFSGSVGEKFSKRNTRLTSE